MVVAAQNTNITTIRSEGKLAHLEQPLIPHPYLVASQVACDAYNALYDAQNEVACLMLGSISPELHRALENYKAYDMIQELKTILILNSVNKDYDQFVQNYNMHNMGKTIAALHHILKLHDKGIPKKTETPTVLAIHEGKIQKDKKSCEGQRDSVCHHYKEVGQWRRNYSSYQAELKKRKNASVASTSACILNMVSTKKVERTPYEIWHGKALKLSYLRVWGCNALVKRDALDKLDPRSINLMVQEASRSHRLLESSGSNRGLELIQEEDTQPSENTSEIHNEVAPIEGFYVDVEEYELGDLNEPPNYKAALSDPEFDKWLETMNTKMQSMKDNLVWVLVDLPPNCRTVGSKWIFKKKTNMDGNVHTFKARLIAKGYTQTYSVDYGKTFSLVADTRAIRILLAIVAFYD
ncbi:zinc finger, CCHC-type containing protein [Tanacetum coccineum]